jgi:septal ring factor EnvC (AmiA/AmiB activator)
MKELEKRLENIYKEIEKFLYLQGEQQNTINNLRAENQELTKKIVAIEQQLKNSERDRKAITTELSNNNTQNNQEINKKIDDLLSEVEQCITLLKISKL